MSTPLPVDSLFKDLEETFESSTKKIGTASQSANRIADSVKEFLSSFDEHEIRVLVSLIKALRTY